MIRLAEEGVGGPAIAVDAAVSQSEIGARAAFDPVVAGELVAIEQGGGVEDEALGVLVRNSEPAGRTLCRPGEDLRHGLEDM